MDLPWKWMSYLESDLNNRPDVLDKDVGNSDLPKRSCETTPLREKEKEKAKSCEVIKIAVNNCC